MRAGSASMSPDMLPVDRKSPLRGAFFIQKSSIRKGGTGAAAGGSGGGQHQTFFALAVVNPSKSCTGPRSHPSSSL